jgi:hypothetical protein
MHAIGRLAQGPLGLEKDFLISNKVCGGNGLPRLLKMRV